MVCLISSVAATMHGQWLRRSAARQSAPGPSIASVPSLLYLTTVRCKIMSFFPRQNQHQQSQPVHPYPWPAHTPPSGQSPSPFPRHSHALSTTATAAGEVFLFGGKTHDRILNDLYVISTRDFPTTLLQTSGDDSSPRYGHCAVLTSTIL